MSTLDALKAQLLHTVMSLETVEAHSEALALERVNLNSFARRGLAAFIDAVDDRIHELRLDAIRAEHERKSFKEELAKRIPREVHKLNDMTVRIKVWEMTDGKCAYCDTKLSPPDGPGEGETLFIEHVVPSSAGGPDHLTNYVPSCRGCNNAKSDRHVLMHIRRLQRRAEQENVVPMERIAYGEANQCSS